MKCRQAVILLFLTADQNYADKFPDDLTRSTAVSSGQEEAERNVVQMFALFYFWTVELLESSCGLTYAQQWSEVGSSESIPPALQSAGWGGHWRSSHWESYLGSLPHKPERLKESLAPGTHPESKKHTNTPQTSIWTFHLHQLKLVVQYHRVFQYSLFRANTQITPGTQS